MKHLDGMGDEYHVTSEAFYTLWYENRPCAAQKALAVVNTLLYMAEKRVIIRDTRVTALTFDMLQQSAQHVKIRSATFAVKVTVVVMIPVPMDLVVVPNPPSDGISVGARLASVRLKMEHHGRMRDEHP
ncbi:hypothetical protein QSH57_001743 [Fusarium oxysporum f. sp. vasinfectum]|nr:hypothetical protein QSH57_001743 [Fusarium oxysporum f. sp. vasinfectum]